MAWMSDEQWAMVSDSREKKSVAAGAFKRRTHCGKGGSVKFPSDYLSAKELKSMSGECVKYASLKKPMTWEEFKVLPDDLKVEYVKGLRDKFNVPDKEIAEMFGVTPNGVLCRWFKTLGLNKGYGTGAKNKTWNREGWLAWRSGADPNLVQSEPVEVIEEPTEETVERVDQVVEVTNVVNVIEQIDISDVPVEAPEAPIAEPTESKTETAELVRAVPIDGSMTFDCPADQALNMLRMVLGDTKIRLFVEWQAVKE